MQLEGSAPLLGPDPELQQGNADRHQGLFHPRIIWPFVCPAASLLAHLTPNAFGTAGCQEFLAAIFFSVVVAASAQVRRYVLEGDERRSKGGDGLVGQGVEEAAAEVLVSLSAATASDCAQPSGAAPGTPACHSCGGFGMMRRSVTDTAFCAEGSGRRQYFMSARKAAVTTLKLYHLFTSCHHVQRCAKQKFISLLGLNKPSLP